MLALDWHISVLGRIFNPSWLSICHCRWVVALRLIPSHFHSYLSVFMDSSCVSSWCITALLSGWQNRPQSVTNDSLSLWLQAGSNTSTLPFQAHLSPALPAAQHPEEPRIAAGVRNARCPLRPCDFCSSDSATRNQQSLFAGGNLSVWSIRSSALFLNTIFWGRKHCRIPVF